MITTTTETEARWMTACPACGAHKGLGPRVCNDCLYLRTDIVPLFSSGASFEEWLAYVMSGRQVLSTQTVTVDELLEPKDLSA